MSIPPLIKKPTIVLDSLPEDEAGLAALKEKLRDGAFLYIKEGTGGGDAVMNGGGLRRGGIAPYYKVAFGGSDGRRAIFWGETEADEAYILCDGGSDGEGGTVPDLRDRMILGAGPAHAAGTIGGSETHTHSLSGTVGPTTLTVAQLASHHHQLPVKLQSDVGSGSLQRMFNVSDGTRYNTLWTGSNQPHTHSLSDGVGAASSLSPFYALAYVIRCK